MIRRFFNFIFKNVGFIGNGLLVLSFISIWSGLARFKTTHILKSIATEENFKGSYEFSPVKAFDTKGKEIESLAKESRYNIASLITDKEIDSDKIYQYIFTAKLIKKGVLAVTIFKDDQVVDHLEVNGKFKRDGFFYLKNKVFSCEGIPYLLGGCYHYKARIGVGSGGNLIYHSATSEQGALLIFLRKGYRYNKTYEFKRLPLKNNRA